MRVLTRANLSCSKFRAVVAHSMFGPSEAGQDMPWLTDPGMWQGWAEGEDSEEVEALGDEVQPAEVR